MTSQERAEVTETIKENEVKAAALRSACRARDGKPECTRESLERCCRMLDSYGPECFPANEYGQIHFARAMMESTADEIRDFLSSLDEVHAKLAVAETRVKELAAENAKLKGELVSELCVGAKDERIRLAARVKTLEGVMNSCVANCGCNEDMSACSNCQRTLQALESSP